MNQLEHEEVIQIPKPPLPDLRVASTRSHPSSSQIPEGETKDCLAARKLQKADRERLRRDRLNEQFIELGNVLDPDRPKNDKATILTDTIQLLKDLTSQVNKLKAEYSTFTEESHELTQEKNDLREEKASLKSDIENLNATCQQRARAMFPWGAMDQTLMMGPPTYPYPVPMPMPHGPIPMHPHMQPYPYYGNQNPCSTFVPYITPSTMVDQQSQQYAATIMQPATRPNVSAKQDSAKNSTESKTEKAEDSNNVATNLELKTPGSATDQDLSSGHGKRQRSPRNENEMSDRSSSSKCSSSRSVQDSSSNSIISSRRSRDCDRENEDK